MASTVALFVITTIFCVMFIGIGNVGRFIIMEAGAPKRAAQVISFGFYTLAAVFMIGFIGGTLTGTCRPFEMCRSVTITIPEEALR